MDLRRAKVCAKKMGIMFVVVSEGGGVVRRGNHCACVCALPKRAPAKRHESYGNVFKTTGKEREGVR